MQQNELMHHGVKGMKWGVRRNKKKPISTFRAQINATKAAEEARKKSIAESRASGDKGIGSFARANRKALAAKRRAYDESIAKDKAYNKQLKAEKKAGKAAVKEAKQDYRNSLDNAKLKRRAAYKTADDVYEKTMREERDAVNAVEEKFAKKQNSIDAQYKSEIDGYRQKADSAKHDMDFWGENSSFYGHYKSIYDQSIRDIADAESRHRGATSANKVLRDMEAIKVRDSYRDQSEKAYADREAAYVKAGKEYVDAILTAENTYKATKKKYKS